MSGANESAAGVVVVTVLYHSSTVLPVFVRSARESAGSTPIEIVAVNNSVDDAEQVRELAGMLDVRLIQASDNPGYGAGVNRAVETTDLSHRSVLIANPDVEFLGDAIAEMHRALRSSDADVAAIGPRIVDADGTVYPSARRLPSISTGVGHAVLGTIAPSNPWTRRYRVLDDYTHDRDSEWLSGACFMMKASWFERLGGFDTSYFMYFEDVDLGARIRSMSGRSRFLATATVRHSGAHSTSQSARLMIRAHHRSAAQYLSRRYPHWHQAPIRIALRFGLEVRSLLLIVASRQASARTSKERRR